MNPNPSASDWLTARGEKWLTHMHEMEAMLAPIDRPLVAALELDAPYRIADIGCGGGATSLELLRRAPRGSQIIGLDVSPPLIEAARARIPEGENALRFELSDVSTAAPPAQPYQRMCSRFGVLFFEDPAAAFRNLRSWLAPQGRIAFAVWAPPAGNHWLISTREAVAELVELPSADPDGPGPFRYADADKLLGLLRAAGFADLYAQHLDTELPAGGGMPAARAAHFALSSLSNFAELLAAAGEHAFQTAHRALTAQFERHQRDGAVWTPAAVHIVTGTAP